MTSNSVPEHMERFLGTISEGWSDATGEFTKVLRFDNRPENGIATYATLGLSEDELDLKNKRTVRQELLLSAHASLPNNEIANFLLYCAEHIKKRGRAALRGEVIDFLYPLVDGATVSAVYATNPTLFDEGLAEFSNANPPVIFALLVPITAKEVSLISTHGWNWFENNLEAQNPDIWDLKRKQEVAE